MPKTGWKAKLNVEVKTQAQPDEKLKHHYRHAGLVFSLHII